MPAALASVDSAWAGHRGLPAWSQRQDQNLTQWPTATIEAQRSDVGFVLEEFWLS